MGEEQQRLMRRGAPQPVFRMARRLAATALALGAFVLVYAVLHVATAGAAKLLSGTFAVESGRQAVTTTDVTLLSQIRGATLMRVKNEDGVYSGWEPYVVSRAWTLAAGDGLKSVTAQFRGASGAKVTLTDEILLDTTGPVTTSDGDGFRNRVVTVTFTPVDALSEVASTWFRLDGGAWREGTSTTLRVWHKKSGLPAGEHTLEFYSTDVLGNVGATGTAIVTLEY